MGSLRGEQTSSPLLSHAHPDGQSATSNVPANVINKSRRLPTSLPLLSLSICSTPTYALPCSVHRRKVNAIVYHVPFMTYSRNQVHLSLHDDMLPIHQSGCDSGGRLRTLMVKFAANWAGAAFVILPALRPYIGSILIKHCP